MVTALLIALALLAALWLGWVLLVLWLAHNTERWEPRRLGEQLVDSGAVSGPARRAR